MTNRSRVLINGMLIWTPFWIEFRYFCSTPKSILINMFYQDFLKSFPSNTYSQNNFI